jgi:hypothetical protein
MIASPQIATVYMESFYAESVTHTTHIWVLKILSMGAFIECGYGSEAEIGGSLVYP